MSLSQLAFAKVNSQMTILQVQEELKGTICFVSHWGNGSVQMNNVNIYPLERVIAEFNEKGRLTEEGVKLVNGACY